MPTLPRRVLIVVENLPVPLDRRVWLEAVTLTAHGYEVSVICPTGRGWDKAYEVIEGVHIHRYPAPPEAHSGAKAYAVEYLWSLWYWFVLARRVWKAPGGEGVGRFEVIQGCNPPDLIFLLALWYRLWGVRYLFDHHDVGPELFEAKFGKKGLLHRIMRVWERMSFATASVSIATNESFRAIAEGRGFCGADRQPRSDRQPAQCPRRPHPFLCVARRARKWRAADHGHPGRHSRHSAGQGGALCRGAAADGRDGD